MVLNSFFKTVKSHIESHLKSSDGTPVKLSLYSDAYFRQQGPLKSPRVFFRYKDVLWEQGASGFRQGQVSFQISIVFPPQLYQQFSGVFSMASEIDNALRAVSSASTNAVAVSNPILKIREGQRLESQMVWEKIDFSIWEMEYTTTLIDTGQVKHYNLLLNNAFSKDDLKQPAKKEALIEKLGKQGIDVTVYTDGKAELVDKIITHKIELNKEQNRK